MPLSESQKWIIGLLIPLVFAGSAPAWWDSLFGEDEEELVLWTQNWQQIQEPIPSACSPCRTNRERLRSVVKGIDSAGNKELKNAKENFLQYINALPVNEADSFYNVAFPPEAREALNEIRRTIRNEAIAHGVDVSAGDRKGR